MSHRKKVLIIGICGVTCGGKTSTAKELNKLLKDSTVFSQDDYFLSIDDPRHIIIPELNHINFDIITSLDMEQMTKDVAQLRANQKQNIESPNNGKQHANFQNQQMQHVFNINESQCHIIIVEGFSILNYKPLADLCDLKYYFTLNYNECFRRRLKRIYDPPDCPGYFDLCAWPEHLKQIAEVQTTVENVVYFDENCRNYMDRILVDIVKSL